MHAVLYLSLALIGVAGIYLTLGAEVLAALQVLIYVGAVVTLILFTVMLTTPSTHMLQPQPTEEEL
jgi:NADH:ubiquinone oxidoreductase subunit 6 (subunit J)